VAFARMYPMPNRTPATPDYASRCIVGQVSGAPEKL